MQPASPSSCSSASSGDSSRARRRRWSSRCSRRRPRRSNRRTGSSARRAAPRGCLRWAPTSERRAPLRRPRATCLGPKEGMLPASEPSVPPASAEADTSNGAPRLATSEPAAEPFPGDEPTRVEPVSAALIEKLRERDEEVPAQEGSAAVTMQDFSLPAAEESDPDEEHWRETFDRFRELKAQLGEPADRISFERFAAKLKKNRADLVAKHNCKGVRFSVYEKDGKAAIRASAIRESGGGADDAERAGGTLLRIESGDLAESDGY